MDGRGDFSQPNIPNANPMNSTNNGLDPHAQQNLNQNQAFTQQTPTSNLQPNQDNAQQQGQVGTNMQQSFGQADNQIQQPQNQYQQNNQPNVNPSVPPVQPVQPIQPQPPVGQTNEPPIAVDPLLKQFTQQQQQDQNQVTARTTATPESAGIDLNIEAGSDISTIEKSPEASIEQQKIAEVSEKIKNVQAAHAQQNGGLKADKPVTETKKDIVDERFSLFGYKIPQKFQTNSTDAKGSDPKASSTWLMFLVERIIKMNPST